MFLKSSKAFSNTALVCRQTSLTTPEKGRRNPIASHHHLRYPYRKFLLNSCYQALLFFLKQKNKKVWNKIIQILIYSCYLHIFPPLLSVQLIFNGQVILFEEAEIYHFTLYETCASFNCKSRKRRSVMPISAFSSSHLIPGSVQMQYKPHVSYN